MSLGQALNQFQIVAAGGKTDGWINSAGQNFYEFNLFTGEYGVNNNYGVNIGVNNDGFNFGCSVNGEYNGWHYFGNGNVNEDGRYNFQINVNNGGDVHFTVGGFGGDTSGYGAYLGVKITI